MWKKLLAVTLTAGLGCLAPCVMGWTSISTESWTIVVDDLSEIEQLEKELLLEIKLSSNGAQSCVACHAAEAVIIGPDSSRKEIETMGRYDENSRTILYLHPLLADLQSAEMVKY